MNRDPSLWDGMEEDPEMSSRPGWDDQFAETTEERNKRLAAKRKARLVYDKTQKTIVCADRTMKTGMFALHSCWKCKDGEQLCVAGNPRQCEYPRARND